MRTWKAAACLIVMVSSMPIFAAASWVNGALDFVLVQDGGTPGHQGIVVVALQTNAAYLPSCHTAPLNRALVDLARPAGKSQLAVLLGADAAGRSVNIDLSETCVEGYALIRNVSMGD